MSKWGLSGATSRCTINIVDVRSESASFEFILLLLRPEDAGGLSAKVVVFGLLCGMLLDVYTSTSSLARGITNFYLALTAVVMVSRGLLFNSGLPPVVCETDAASCVRMRLLSKFIWPEAT